MPNNSAQISDEDNSIAAALTAVYAYMQSEEEAACAQASSDKQPTIHKDFNSWGAASRIEGTRLRTDKAKLDKYRKSSASSGSAWKSLLIVLILWTVSTPSACALERISTPSIEQSPSAGADEIRLDATSRSNSLSTTTESVILRILLAAGEQFEIVVPDGAELVDEQTKKLLAVLPPQSKWKVSTSGSMQNPQLCFAGTCGSVSAGKLVIAGRTSGSTSQANYARAGQFASAPQIRNSMSPSFILPLKVYPTQTSDTYRAVAFTPNAGAAQLKVKPPKVVQPGFLLKPPGPNGLISLAGKSYRGDFVIRSRNEDKPGFQIINLIELDDYLLSVVPSEMPASWDLEGLKAQTIAARSYAIANLGKHQSEGYDLKANTEDQVYLGVQTEAENSNRAVAETKGLVLTHEGKTVCAFFHSSGGGHTELAEHVWRKGVPYLQAVPDFDHQSPHFAWNREIQVASIEEALRKQGKDVGAVLGIFPLTRTSSQRWQNALIAGTLQTLIVSGEELRKLFQAPSSVFNIGQAANAYLLAGRGFGHGLGMSQWGAKYLAEQGYNAAQILSYYYKDVAIQPIPFALSAERAQSGRQE
jgi:stage II sporulation protein D